MWVARDKDNNLNLFITRPFYDEDIEKYITYISSKSKFIELDNSLFPELTWEDGPIEVTIIPTKFEIIPGKPCSVCSHMYCVSHGMKCINDI